ncbi:MAG TPA: HlyD family efflux transporter periplasmic adaptor subunit, partial [Thermoanaerobaculia bacterium]|nr:HlyD family efflux transporter periplasmic adaptor subunit [Thermoanaerobaculia bacterium]
MKAPLPVFALLAFAACGRSEKDTPIAARAAAVPPPPLSSAAQVAAVSNVAPAGYLGVLLPRQAIDVSAPAGGRLEAVTARPGDRLRRGASIARMDGQSLAHQLESSRATLREAEAAERQASLALADAQSRQQRRLSIPESFSKEDLAQADIQKQQAEAALESAKARVAGQRAEVQRTQNSLAEAEIRAPFDGTVAQRYLDAGATVGPGTPIIRLVSEGEPMVRFAVPSGEAATLHLAAPIVANAPGWGDLTGT